MYTIDQYSKSIYYGFSDTPDFKNIDVRFTRCCIGVNTVLPVYVYTLYHNDIIGHAIMLMFILILKSIKYNRNVNK